MVDVHVVRGRVLLRRGRRGPRRRRLREGGEMSQAEKVLMAGRSWRKVLCTSTYCHYRGDFRERVPLTTDAASCGVLSIAVRDRAAEMRRAQSHIVSKLLAWNPGSFSAFAQQTLGIPKFVLAVC